MQSQNVEYSKYIKDEVPHKCVSGDVLLDIARPKDLVFVKKAILYKLNQIKKTDNQ